MKFIFSTTEHFWQRVRERELADKFEAIAKAVEHGRKIPQRNKTGAVIPNIFANIGDDLTVISREIGRTIELITAYENEVTL